jgi:hydroxyethylthiazole kinase-like uncharacterized protein yjeF
VIPLLSRAAVRDLDCDAVDRLGVPSLLLMENAGRGAFEALRELAGDRLERVLIVGGTGQNGGDGWVVARHLVAAGFSPSIVLVGDSARIAGDALVNWLALERLGIARVAPTGLDSRDLSPLSDALGRASVIVDALFGTGLDRPLSGLHADVVERINACPASVLALDLPSGVDAETGAVLGAAVRADWTVTFAAHKRGLDQYPGHGLAGAVRCVSIGVPGPTQAPAGRIEPGDFGALLRSRRSDAHKGQAGHVLLIAGAPGHTGAAVLAGLGALRCGAGLCTIAPRGDARTSIEAKTIELMTAALPSQAQAVLELAADKQAVVIGPGLGLDAEARALASELAHSLPLPAVLDADALTAIGPQHATLRGARGPRVLTPHPGEAGRLLGISSARVQADRYAAAEQIARQSGCVTVLKGARSIVADPSGRMRVCPTGTPAMAVGGTGDVLAGAIGALLGQQLPAFDAAVAGVYLHGLAGELAAIGDRGLLASELAAALPKAIAQCLAG